MMRSLKVNNEPQKAIQKKIPWNGCIHSNWGEELIDKKCKIRKYFVFLCVMKYKYIMYVHFKTWIAVQKCEANLLIKNHLLNTWYVPEIILWIGLIFLYLGCLKNISSFLISLDYKFCDSFGKCLPIELVDYHPQNLF